MTAILVSSIEDEKKHMDLANIYNVSSLQRGTQSDEKVVALASSMFLDVTSASISPASAAAKQQSPRDFSGSLQLVQEVVEAMRISDERVSELESELHQLSSQANEEISRLKAQLENTELNLQHAQRRIRETEERAAQAEAGLAKLNDAIKGSFVPLLREFEARRQASVSSVS